MFNKWHMKTSFLECLIGYFGKDCAKICFYPTYGEDCQSMCDCSKDDCHYSWGCFSNAETLTYQHISMFCLYNFIKIKIWYNKRFVHLNCNNYKRFHINY